jgi:hypothetical protein
MRADNTRHIIDAARQRHELTRAKAIQALRTLDSAGTPVTFETVARTASVSRSWLYAQPDIRAEIEQLRAVHHRSPATALPRTAAGIRCVTAAAAAGGGEPAQQAARRRESAAPRTTCSRPRRGTQSRCGMEEEMSKQIENLLASLHPATMVGRSRRITSDCTAYLHARANASSGVRPSPGE